LDHDSISLDLREIQRIQPPQDSEGVRTRVQANDILISVTADVGMVGLVPDRFEEAYINQHVALARPIPAVHAPYLAWCLTSPPSQTQFKELQRGATKVGLGLDDIRAIDLRLPPLPEQRRIVAEIEKQFTRLDAGVAALRRVQTNLKRYRAAVLKAACEGKLVPTEAELHRQRKTKNTELETGAELLTRILAERRKNWKGRGKYKEPAAPDTAKLPPLQEGWTWANFEQISERVTVGFVGSMKHEYVAGGVPFLRGQNVRENKFDPEGLLYVSPTFHQKLSKSAIHPGDLAVVRSGSVGVTCVIPDTLPEANCSDLVLIQRPLGFIPQYGAYFMNSLAKRHVEAGKVGVALTHFNTKSVAAMVVPLPPSAEQTRIVAEVERRLSVVEELESAVSATRVVCQSHNLPLCIQIQLDFQRLTILCSYPNIECVVHEFSEAGLKVIVTDD
jgi:type I restriction enzyme S subunit